MPRRCVVSLACSDPTPRDPFLPAAFSCAEPPLRILKHIESLGYKVSAFHINEMVEMHAQTRPGDALRTAFAMLFKQLCFVSRI